MDFRRQGYWVRSPQVGIAPVYSWVGGGTDITSAWASDGGKKSFLRDARSVEAMWQPCTEELLPVSSKDLGDQSVRSGSLTPRFRPNHSLPPPVEELWGSISSGKYIEFIQMVRVLKMTEWTAIQGLEYFNGIAVDWEMSPKKSYNQVVIKKWPKFPMQTDGWIDLGNK